MLLKKVWSIEKSISATCAMSRGGIRISATFTGKTMPAKYCEQRLSETKMWIKTVYCNKW